MCTIDVLELLSGEGWQARLAELDRLELEQVAQHLEIEFDSSVRKGLLLLKVYDYVKTVKTEGEMKVVKEEVEVTPTINLSEALKFVPHFQECNVAEFFVSFERIAAKLQWPQEYWTTLIQSKLIGRAQKVYVTLDESLSSDYDNVKAIVLKAYELVPEAYRQRFRNLQKDREQTFVEFARGKRQYAEDWLKSKEVDNFEGLKELVLVEEFKRCVPDKLKVHLEELKIDTLQEVAIASDEYYLSHKNELGVMSNIKPGCVRKRILKLAIVNRFPVKDVDIVLGNDVAYKNNQDPILMNREIAVVTRSRASGVDAAESTTDVDCSSLERSISSSSGSNLVVDRNIAKDLPNWTKEELIKAQKQEFQDLHVESGEVDDLTVPKFKIINNILYRLSRPREAGNSAHEVLKQILVPYVHRIGLMSLAHDNGLAGHFGIHKTAGKLLKDYYWPKLKSDVKKFVNSCSICQKVGKPNQVIPKAPLCPIPVVSEPFKEIIIDVVGPLPRTRSGNEYIFTMMDKMSRYPEAIPLRSIKSAKIVEVLINFFTRFGMPKVVQSDCGTNFVSKYFKEKMAELGIKHVTSSPYHPESQGALERFHQTLKSMIRKYCLSHGSEWDKELPYLLFAFRSAPSQSLGLSPFNLVFGHCVRGPLDVVRESWEGDIPDINLLDYLTNLGDKMTKAWEFARENLLCSQRRMKYFFDRKTKIRNFAEGDKVLVLLPLPEEEFNEDKYGNDGNFPTGNKTSLKNFDSSVSHLSFDKRRSLKKLVFDYKELFSDVPGRTSVLEHDVDVGNATPVKQSPYRLNPFKSEVVAKEVEYMLKHGLIEPSKSPWSSPVVLVKKPDGEFRMCFDYRRVNEVTKPDSYPLPRIEDCIDRMGKSKYISKFDLLKGYWQVPLSKRARALSAFVTPQGLFQCRVMPFGMKNAAATFQRLMNTLVYGLEGCVVYIDDIVIYSDDWDTHLKRIKALFEVLKKAGLVVNLKKSEFAKAKVVYLGHVVGDGKVTPKQANVEAIEKISVPKCRRDVRKFLGLLGYYRRFVKNFSDIAVPLTNLLKKKVAFIWTKEAQNAFESLKGILLSFPILRAPDFDLPFSLATDASDVGVGAVLLQNDEQGVSHPVAFFSKKLTSAQRKYSTVEKETLALILAINHFSVYLSSTGTPIKIMTDHNPLTFINRYKNKNQRLMRWSIMLQEWNLQFSHIPGRDNVVADALSRSVG
ncbi:uncharacterized protein [Macrobrachium rosenbergii]|uniref:uncharacterized protein n=1 Tax=Macrobrachium rosenbergii TaxID=79674 RepID=UPI0034D707B5